MVRPSFVSDKLLAHLATCDDSEVENMFTAVSTILSVSPELSARQVQEALRFWREIQSPDVLTAYYHTSPVI